MPEKDPIPVTLRPYQETDWQALCEIHDLARLDELRDSVGLDAFLDLETTWESEGLMAGELWVACLAGRVEGFVAFSDDEITWLYVHPRSYGMGIGRLLLRKAIQSCGASVSTEVLKGNDKALGLYLSEGFEIQELKKGKLTGNETFSAEGYLLLLSK